MHAQMHAHAHTHTHTHIHTHAHTHTHTHTGTHLTHTHTHTHARITHTHTHFKQGCWGNGGGKNREGRGRRLLCCPSGHQTPSQKKWLWTVEHKSPLVLKNLIQKPIPARQNWILPLQTTTKINPHDTQSSLMFNQHTWYTILTHVQSTHMIHDLDSCSINTHDTRSWLMFSQHTWYMI